MHIPTKCRILLSVICLIFIANDLSAQEDPQEQFSNQTPTQVAQQYDIPSDETQPEGCSRSPKGGFSIHFGGSFPTGNFREGPIPNTEDALTSGKLSAAIGFQLGVKGKIPVPVEGVGIIVSGDFIYNGVTGTLEDRYESLEMDGYYVERPRYLNIPLFVGLNYRYGFSPTFGIWAEGALGPNFRKITNEEISISRAKYTLFQKSEYKMQTSFGFQAGVGIMVNKFSLGLHYYGLGKAEIKGELTRTQNTKTTTESFSYKKSAHNVLMIRLGHHF